MRWPTRTDRCSRRGRRERRGPAALALILALATGTFAVAQVPAPEDLKSAVVAADDARVQSREHRQAVATALTREDPVVRVLALRAIGRTRRAEFLPQAMGGLRNPSLDVRREAAFAVGHIGSGSPEAHDVAERALRDALAVETDMLVLSALAEEYGRLLFPTRAALDAAARTLRESVGRIGKGGPLPPIAELGVARAAEAMARRAARLKEWSEDVHALLAPLYEPSRVAADTPRDVLRARIRRLAIAGLLALDQAAPPASPRPSASAFERATRDADAEVRRLGVIGIARGDVSPDTARALLADDMTIVRHAVVSRIGPTQAAIAEAGTRDAHLNVRLAALDALGAAEACRAACSTRLDAPDAFGAAWHEAAHALDALARTDAAAAAPHVERASTATTWQVRMYAARAAQHTRQADVLASLAADAHVNVRHAALVSWRAAQLPGLVEAAVAALASDDGQLLLEAANALKGTSSDQAVAALRAALARATAQRRETSRDWRMALLERIDELDADRLATLRPYLSDFDPAIADRAAALLNARLPDDQAVPSPRLDPSPRTPRDGAPAWAGVTALEGATVALRLKGHRQLTIRLYPQVAPTAVARLVAQVRRGDWNGRTFHRVEPGFVVQGGSPAANEYAGADTFTRDEFSALAHVRGTVGISTRGPDTGDGQIFIDLVDNPRLDFAFTIIGSVTGNLSLLDDIVEGEVIESAMVAVARR